MSAERRRFLDDGEWIDIQIRPETIYVGSQVMSQDSAQVLINFLENLRDFVANRPACEPIREETDGE